MFYISEKPDFESEDREYWEGVKDKRDKMIYEKFEGRGLSGAQVGGASNLANVVCRKGYKKAISEDAVRDRLIMVKKELDK